MAQNLTPRDREAVMAFYGPWTEHMLAGDFEALAQMYTDDAVVMAPNHETVRGRDGVIAFMRSYPRVTRARFHADEIDGAGDIAYVCGRYEITMEPEGGEPIEDRGKFIEVRRRGPDGEWRLARDIFNSDLDAGHGA